MSKLRGQPFAPGNTVGRGRPKGSRNKAKSLGQALLDEYSLPLTRKCIALALGGNLGALRICMERISPARLDACLRISLPPIKTAQDVNQAAEKVTQALGRGGITPTEGGKVMNLLEGRTRIFEKVFWEGRLDKLEENRAAGDLPPRPESGPLSNANQSDRKKEEEEDR
jgi:hypothetical protein